MVRSVIKKIKGINFSSTNLETFLSPSKMQNVERQVRALIQEHHRLMSTVEQLRYAARMRNAQISRYFQG